MYSRPQFASLGRAIRRSCFSFVSQAAVDAGIAAKYGLDRVVLPVRNIASLEAWTRDWLRLALAALEGVVPAAACRAAGNAATLAGCHELMDASLAPPTQRAASRGMGVHVLQLGETWPWSADAAARPLDHTGGGSPHYEVLCDEQSRHYCRLFRS